MHHTHGIGISIKKVWVVVLAWSMAMVSWPAGAFTGELTGTVQHADGSPVANVVMALTAGDETVATVTTDENGHWAFTDVQIHYAVRPSSDDFVFYPAVLPFETALMEDNFHDHGFTAHPKGGGPAGMAGAGTADNPYIIVNAEQLQAMRLDLHAHYVLYSDIRVEETMFWSDFAGFEPIGSEQSPFSGSFDGQGHFIMGLFIDRSNEDDVGMFGTIGASGVVRNFSIWGQTYGRNVVGGIVGMNKGTIEHVEHAGEVFGQSVVGGIVGKLYGTVRHSQRSMGRTGAGNEAGGIAAHVSSGGRIEHTENRANVEAVMLWAGGLAAVNEGDIVQSSNAASISANAQGAGGIAAVNKGTITETINEASVRTGGQGAQAEEPFGAGGLVAVNHGVIDQSHNTAPVQGTHHVGGLVSVNEAEGIIENAYNAGIVKAKSTRLGGIAGTNAGTVRASHNMGIVDGDNKLVGGAVGYNDRGTVQLVYNTGEVKGFDVVGGLVGENYDGIVALSYNTGSVKSGWIAGGLVGENNGTIENAYNMGAATGERATGGIAGENRFGVVAQSYNVGALHDKQKVGGVVALDARRVEAAFFDKDTSETDVSTGGTGLTTEQMQHKTTFTEAGWNFVNVWQIAPGEYPDLMANPR